MPVRTSSRNGWAPTSSKSDCWDWPQGSGRINADEIGGRKSPARCFRTWPNLPQRSKAQWKSRCVRARLHQMPKATQECIIADMEMLRPEPLSAVHLNFATAHPDVQRDIGSKLSSFDWRRGCGSSRASSRHRPSSFPDRSSYPPTICRPIQSRNRSQSLVFADKHHGDPGPSMDLQSRLWSRKVGMLRPSEASCYPFSFTSLLSEARANSAFCNVQS